MEVTEEHTPTRQDELIRIQASNGLVTKGRVDGALAVSRAIGDIQYKNFIISEPENVTYDI